MRAIFRYSGANPKPAEDIERIKQIPGLDVLDESPRMLLVEADWPTAQSLAATLPNWTLSTESTYDIPEKRPKPVE